MINWILLKLKYYALQRTLRDKKATDREKILVIQVSDKGLVSKIFNELFQLNNKETNDLQIDERSE